MVGIVKARWLAVMQNRQKTINEIRRQVCIASRGKVKNFAWK